MKIGSIVKVPGYSRHWVALSVTREMIRQGVQASKPGVHLFGGLWYGRDLENYRSYGKMLPVTRGRKVNVRGGASEVPRGKFKIVGHISMRKTVRDDLRTKSRAVLRAESRVPAFPV